MRALLFPALLLSAMFAVSPASAESSAAQKLMVAESMCRELANEENHLSCVEELLDRNCKAGSQADCIAVELMFPIQKKSSDPPPTPDKKPGKTKHASEPSPQFILANEYCSDDSLPASWFVDCMLAEMRE